MGNFTVGPIYSRIGLALANLVRADPVGAFLLAQAGENWSEAAIFQLVGDRVVYRFSNEDLDALILDAWEAEEKSKRWAELHYTILDGRFNAKLIYLEEIQPEANDDGFARRDRIVREKFGDKPIDYSDP